MATVTRRIRRNIVAKQAEKEDFSRSKFFEWRRQYIAQLNQVISNLKSSKKQIKEAKESLRTLKF